MDEDAPGDMSDVHPGADLRRLHDVIGLAVIHLDEQAAVLSYNAPAERLLRWAGGDTRGRSLIELLVEPGHRAQPESFAEALSAGHQWTGQLVPAGPDQGTASQTVVLPLPGQAHGSARFVVLLLEPESPLWPLLTGVLDGWLVVQGPGRVTFASAVATRLLGSPGTDLGRLPVLVGREGAPEPMGDALARHLAAGLPRRPLELRIDHDGLGRWVEAAAVRTNPSGPLAGVVWRLRDVSDRVRVESRHEELQRALDTRVEIEQAKGFLAGRDGIGTDGAFHRLRRHARDHNLEIREVARRVVAGTLVLDQTD